MDLVRDGRRDFRNRKLEDELSQVGLRGGRVVSENEGTMELGPTKSGTRRKVLTHLQGAS